MPASTESLIAAALQLRRQATTEHPARHEHRYQGAREAAVRRAARQTSRAAQSAGPPAL